MATRSNIAIRRGDEIESIYSHWDGYPEGVGRTLLDNYNNEEIIEELISMGDASSLRETLEDSVFYERDRGEEGVKSMVGNWEDYKIRLKLGWFEYAYLYDNGVWTVDDFSGNGYVDLKELLESKGEV